MRRAFALILRTTLAAAIAAVPAAQDMVIRGVGTFPTVEGPRGTPAASTTGTALILGRVVDADSGQPISGATVTIGGGNFGGPALGPAAQAPASSMTNGQGHFVLSSLPAGTYTLSAATPGYLTASYGWRRPEGGPSRSVDLADGQRVTDVEIRVWKFGVITGTVEDELGDPVVGAQVRALRRDASGRLVPGMTASTDDRGIYRLSGLVPGDYLVMVPSTYSALPTSVVEGMRAPGQLSAALSRDIPLLGLTGTGGMPVGDMTVAMTSPLSLGPNAAVAPGEDGRISAYQTTFHPAATAPGGATVVRVTSGAERSGIDLDLTLTRMLSVSGAVTGPTGPMPNLGLRLVPAFSSAITSDSFLDTATTATGPDGRFTFLGVPPGQYEVRALRLPRTQTAPGTQTIMVSGGGAATTVVSMAFVDGPPPAIVDEPTYWARVPVTVGTRDVTGVAVTLTTGTRLVGQVVFEGGNPPAYNDRRRLAVGLVSSDDRQVGLPPVAPVDENLQFRTAEYPGGRFLVNVTAVPAGWTVVEARAGSVNALAEPLTVSGGEVDGVVVTLSRRAPRVSGTVRGSTQGDPQAVVVLFPADHRSWIEAGMPGRMLRTVDVRSNGAYDATGLVPGDYAVVAVPAALAVDARQPSTIEALARQATRITLALGDSKTQPLTVADVR